VLGAIRRQMSSDGYLLLGAAETVLGVSDSFVSSPGLPGIFVPSRPAANSVPEHVSMPFGREMEKPQLQLGSQGS